MQIVYARRRLIAQRDDEILLQNAGLVRRAAWFDGHHFHRARLRQIETARQFARQRHIAGVQTQIAAHHPAMLEQLRQNVFGDVNRDGETQTLRGANDGGVDADDVTATIDQRAATVAGIQRGIRLDHVIDQMSGDAAQGTP